MKARELSVIHQAVVFFDGGKLVKEMLHVEFEAVLDQVVGLPEFAGREIEACFLRINPRLQIVGCVFFLVDFDARGYVNRSWNIPLAHLLDNAGRGPDLGAGRIRLACRSQCSIPWHARQLWDPALEGPGNSFRWMQQALRRNRLGLQVEPEAEDIGEPPLLNAGIDGERVVPAAARAQNQRLQQEYRGKLAALQEEQRLQLATFKSKAEEQLEQLHQRYQIQLNQMKEALESDRRMFMEEKRRGQDLKEKLEAQAAAFQQLRQQVQRERGLEQSGLHKPFEAELKARVEQASAELKEMLDMREVELFYREEQLGNLREEVTRLRQERESLINQSGDRLLQRLMESGVTFVTYQPGAEAMTIPGADMARYLDSPLAYVAEKSFVVPELYQQWLSHRELPVCAAPLDGGSICGEPVDKVERPGQFQPGSSDRCARHGPGRHHQLGAQQNGGG
jgi:hypothetical protein